jgi:hypothetical protein
MTQVGGLEARRCEDARSNHVGDDQSDRRPELDVAVQRAIVLRQFRKPPIRSRADAQAAQQMVAEGGALCFRSRSGSGVQ